MATHPKPNLIVSKCLGFDHCRYNGDIINDPVVDQLKDYVNIITVCPEVEIGLGVPRQPIRLVNRDDEIILYQPASGNEYTGQMNSFINDFLDKQKDIDGFILKNRSPSCGMFNVKVYQGFDANKSPVNNGRGLFGGAVLDRFNGLAIEDEGRLKNFSIREYFLTKLFALASFRMISQNLRMKDLVHFHATNKFLFMAHNQEGMRVLGRITANPDKKDAERVFEEYKKGLYNLFSSQTSYKSWINVLMHAFGFVSQNLSGQEKTFFLNSIEEYRDERIPLSVLSNLLYSWALRFDEKYLLEQKLFNPFPKELVEITDSGKGRNR
jgi:uncharacterized protein YbgA (DUF1722 family)/uncharacterized protein YbbK (DUF523 family)